MKKTILVAVVVLMTTGVLQAATMDWVSVGNAGNANDDTGYGGVDYEYRIGKYEVTAGQYTEFLNAVAATDTSGLYNPSMLWPYGCKIQRSGSPGGYTYSVAADRANRPVNYVGWYDTLRFTNWLHNGQGTGDTEDGAYDMSLGDSMVRKAGATVWLPSEDEWYKAAYHKNDGVTGNYFNYPTSSDSIPSNDLVEPIDPGNNATFFSLDDNDYTIGGPYYRTKLGAHENSDSPYGTFDMGGNVSEWSETMISSSSRSFRGGSYYQGVFLLHSSERNYCSRGNESGLIGFRIASIPEPATLLLLGLGGLMVRRKRI